MHVPPPERFGQERLLQKKQNSLRCNIEDCPVEEKVESMATLRIQLQ